MPDSPLGLVVGQKGGHVTARAGESADEHPEKGGSDGQGQVFHKGGPAGDDPVETCRRLFSRISELGQSFDTPKSPIMAVTKLIPAMR